MTLRTKRIFGKLLILVGLLTLGATLIHATLFDSNPITYLASSLGLKTSSAQTIARPASPTDPRRLEIPSLGVNAAVQDVGIKVNGALATPSNFTDVAWYKDGPAPGQIGTAVIDGHVDNGLALAGVFKHLGNIELGESVYVVDNAGKKFHFIVTSIKTYPYDSTPPENIFDDGDAGSHLNLITCTGSWVPAGKTYDERLVVYTTLVT